MNISPRSRFNLFDWHNFYLYEALDSPRFQPLLFVFDLFLIVLRFCTSEWKNYSEFIPQLCTYSHRIDGQFWWSRYRLRCYLCDHANDERLNFYVLFIIRRQFYFARYDWRRQTLRASHYKATFDEIPRSKWNWIFYSTIHRTVDVFDFAVNSLSVFWVKYSCWRRIMHFTFERNAFACIRAHFCENEINVICYEFRLVCTNWSWRVYI